MPVNNNAMKVNMLIPRAIANDDRLSVAARGLYVILYASTELNTSIHSLRHRLSLSTNEVEHLLTELVRFGWITWLNSETILLNEEVRSDGSTSNV